MKSGVAAGAVAGVVGGIVGVVVAAIGMLTGLFAPFAPTININIIIANIVLTIIFGAIFGAIYSRFHDLVPGVGVSKGLYFGLMIWLIKDIAAGSYVVLMGQIPIAIGLIFVGFFMWITYAPVLAVLYKK